MMRKVFILVLFFAAAQAAYAQSGVRVPLNVQTQLTIAGVTNAVGIPPNVSVSFCNAPANAVPCTNKATTYTDATLSTPCSTSTQIVLDGTTSCVANLNAQQQGGVWVAAGQYAYTVTINGTNFGPFFVTAGGTSGPAGPPGPPGATGTLASNTGITVGGVATFKGPGPFSDIVAFGARAVVSAPQTTATCTGASANVTLAAASTFQNNDGFTALGCGPTLTLTTPAAPTVTPSLARTGTGEGGGNTGPQVVNSGTGSSTYKYEVIYRDAAGGFTAPSAATTITTGLAALGPTTCAISTETRSNASVTINFSSACAGAVQNARFQVTSAATGSFNGWFNVTTVNSSTQIVVSNTGIDSRGLGWQNGDSNSSTGGTATFILSNHLLLTWQTGMWEAYVCAERPGDVSFKLIGQTGPSVGSWRELQFDDYGSPYNDNQTYPSYITNALCNGGSAQNDPLTTTIVSGAGTTSIVVANAASNSSSGLLATFDDGPALLAAANAAASIGRVYIPPAAAGSSYPIYSYTVLPANTAIMQAGTLNLYETLQVGQHDWSGQWISTSHPSFMSTANAAVGVQTANPGILFTRSGSMDHLEIASNNTNGGTLVLDQQDNTGQNFDYVNFISNSSANDYLSMAFVVHQFDPAGEQKYVFNHVLMTSALPTTPLTTPILYFAPDQDGAGNLKTQQDGHFSFTDTSWAGRGSEEPCLLSTDWVYRGHTVRQGGYEPLLTLGSCTGNSVSNVDISQAILDTDTSGYLNVLAAGGTVELTVHMNYVQMSSVESGSSAATPPITGALSLVNPIVTSGALGAIPNISGRQFIQEVFQPSLFAEFSPEVFPSPNSYIYWPMAAPTSPTAAVAAGGSIAAETLQFAVSAIDPAGNETIVSPLSSSVTTSGTCPASGNCSVTVGATAPTGAVKFNIYECGQSVACPGARLTATVNSLPVTLTTIGAGTGPLSVSTAGVSGINSSLVWGQLVSTPTVSVSGILVGSLPAAAAGNAGQVRTVTDSTNVAAEGQTCVGGSTNTALAFSNGVAWKCF